MKRLLALLVAAAMVGGAFFVRARGEGDGDGGPGDGGGRGAALVCPPELAGLCGPVAAEAGLDLRVEDPGATAEGLLALGDGDRAGEELWLTSAGWVALVGAERGRANLDDVVGEPQVVARSRVVLAVWQDRASELTQRCGRPVDWRCLAEHDGQTLTRGDEVGTGSPEIGALGGLEVAANQAASLIGRPDFASNDFDAAFRRLADRLVDGATASPLSTMRSRGPGQLTAAGTHRAGARSTASNFGTIVITEPEPATTVDLVLSRIGQGDAPGDVAEALGDALAEAGWSAAEDATLPAGNGLPNGGVLAAIRTLWA